MANYTWTANADHHDGTERVSLRGGSLVLEKNGYADLTSQEVADLTRYGIILTPGIVPGAVSATKQNGYTTDDELAEAVLQLQDARAGSAQKVAARGREPVRKVLVRNDFTNPRAAGLTNWTQASTGSPTNVQFTDVDDASFILGADYTANGHCAKVTADDLPVGATLQVQPGKPAGVAPTVTTSGLMTFGRAKVKVVACPTDTRVRLQFRMTDAADGNVTIRTFHTNDAANAGDEFILEGHGLSTNVRIHLIVLIDNAVNAGAVDIRVGNAQIVVDPDGDVPECVDGYRVGGSWDGSVDASTSTGYVWPVVHDADFIGGFNYFHVFHNEVPIDPERIADMCVELGLTHLRLSTGAGTLGVDGVWPEGADGPDWTQGAIWPVMEALHKRGIKYMPIVAAAAQWMTTDGSYYPSRLDPAHETEFLTLQTSLLDQAPAGLIDSMEVYNEPNLVASDPDMTPAIYAARLSAIYDSVKAKYPDVKIIGGSLARYQSDDASGTSVLTFLRGMYAAGAKTKMDEISVHPYSDDPATRDPSVTGQLHSGFDQIMRQVRQVKHENADDARPIRVTEYGWIVGAGATTERQQMQTMCLWRGRLGRVPDVSGAFFHTLASDHEVAAGSRNYSALEVDSMRRRPFFDAFRRDGMGTGERWRFLTPAANWSVTSTGGFPSRFKYRKDGDSVEVRANLTHATGTGAITDVIGTLPDGYMPYESVVRPCNYFNGSAHAIGLIQVNGRNNTAGNAGQIKWIVGGSIASGNVSYLGFDFIADQ